MFHRLAQNDPSARLLHFATFAAIIVIIATAAAVAWQLDDDQPVQRADATSCQAESWPYRDCRTDASQARSIRLISPDRIQKTSVYTTAAKVETPGIIPPAAVQPVLPQPVVEETSVPMAAGHQLAPAPSAKARMPAVSPRARAEAPRRARQRTAEQQPASGFAVTEKSHSGAGATFDAVH